jgi:hypothetical protein
MRKSIGLLFGSMLVLGFAGSAGATTLNWSGTLSLDLGALPSVTTSGSGVATVNSSGGVGHLTTLRLAGGITGTGIAVVTDPDTSGQIPSVRLTATLGTGTLSNIDASNSVIHGNNKLPVKGLARVCLINNDCGSFIQLAISKGASTAVGVGGLLGAFGGTLGISLEAAPWTLAPNSGINQTVNGAFQTLTRTGFAHGPVSNNSSTNLDSGVVQLISPATVTSQGLPANNQNLSLFSTLTLHYVPEPGLILLIGSGVVGLGLLGRSRLRK